MIVSGWNVGIWFLVPIANFFFWMHYAQREQYRQSPRCATTTGLSPAIRSNTIEPVLCPEEIDSSATDTVEKTDIFASCSPTMITGDASLPHIEWVNTVDYEKVWEEHLAAINFRAGVLRFYHPKRSITALVKTSAEDVCTSLYFQFSNSDKIHDYEANHCVGLVHVPDIGGAWNAIRFDADLDEAGLERNNQHSEKLRKEDPDKFVVNTNEHNHAIAVTTGFIHAVPGDPGRNKIYDKLGGLLRHFDGEHGIAAELEAELNENNIKAGDDVVVMVVNEGEIDLYLNFACSCQQNNVTIKNLLVFAASPEIVTMIESTGAMGIYHPGYAAVSRRASDGYMDRTFVDMMWYKAFSVYLLLRLKINVLFQDADLVWFRDPFPYFQQVIKENEEKAKRTGSYFEAFFADDGQRSLRYAPFYANSGFYYLLANERSVYFTWSIMISFDLIQVSGSHQNVFTFKLIEATALSASKSKLLPLEQFPTGITYHHDPLYMEKLKKHHVRPYNYHMCWTAGKKEKLEYFHDVAMWYVKKTCGKDALTPTGSVFGAVSAKDRKGADRERRWKHLSSMCCHSMPGGDYQNGVETGPPLPRETRKY